MRPQRSFTAVPYRAGVKRLLLLAATLVLAVPASAARLPIVADRDWWPVFSPNGGRVAFTRVNGQGRSLSLYTVNLATRRVTKVGTSVSRLSPTWSPDSKRIAFASGGSLYVAYADGSGKHRYTAPAPALAPAWRPGSVDLAYLTAYDSTSTDLWVGGTLWARDAIAQPSWSPDGTTVAFARANGIYVATGPSTEQRVAQTLAEPGAPVFSPDGTRIAYVDGNQLYVVPADGSTPPVAETAPLSGLGPVSWSRDSTRLVTTDRKGVVIVPLGQALRRIASKGGVGAAYSPSVEALAYSGPIAGCIGHYGIDYATPSVTEAISGTCSIGGTSGPDTIEGTPEPGDVIVARGGNDRIHVNDGHTDTVFCGPGRDTVWADRKDRLRGCEVVHR
jgi:Tol biopolymer transport system component